MEVTARHRLPVIPKMLTRAYHFSDAKKLDVLTRRQGITDSALDEIFCTGERGNPSGMLVYRPGAFVHELECGQGAARLLRAEALANYAVAHARAKGLATAIFLVRGNNPAMMRFVESLGAIRQTEDGDVLYTLTP